MTKERRLQKLAADIAVKAHVATDAALASITAYEQYKLEMKAQRKAKRAQRREERMIVGIVRAYKAQEESKAPRGGRNGKATDL
jgi:hypothetical protein